MSATVIINHTSKFQINKSNITMSTTTAKKPNLFAAAKKVEPRKAAKEKLEVVIKEAEHEGFSAKLKKLSDLKHTVSEAETEIETLEQDVKAVGVQEFIRLYEEKKVRPESFHLAGEKGGKFLVIVMDKYAMVPDDTRAAELRAAYGDEVVYTNTEYKFDNVLLAKHMDAISEAIMNIRSMTSEEKQNLFAVTEKHYIAKGSIERYMQYNEEERAGFFYI